MYEHNLIMQELSYMDDKIENIDRKLDEILRILGGYGYGTNTYKEQIDNDKTRTIDTRECYVSVRN